MAEIWAPNSYAVITTIAGQTSTLNSVITEIAPTIAPTAVPAVIDIRSHDDPAEVQTYPTVLAYYEGSIEILDHIYIPQTHRLPVAMETHYRAWDYEEAMRVGHIYAIACIRLLEGSVHDQLYSGVYAILEQDMSVVPSGDPMIYTSTARATLLWRGYRRT